MKGTETRIRPVSRSFFEFARLARPRRPRRGIQAVEWTRHLFSQRSQATLNPMAPLSLTSLDGETRW